MDLFEKYYSKLEEGKTPEITKKSIINNYKNALDEKGIPYTVSNNMISFNYDGLDYDIVLDRTTSRVSPDYRQRRFEGNGTVVDGEIYDEAGNHIGRAYYGIKYDRKHYSYAQKSNDIVFDYNDPELKEIFKKIESK